MLFIDLIDIVYFVIGVLIGATVQAYLDSRTCEKCERSEGYDE